GLKRNDSWALREPRHENRMVSDICPDVDEDAFARIVARHQGELFHLVERPRVMEFHDRVVGIGDQEPDALAIDNTLYDRSVGPAFSPRKCQWRVHSKFITPPNAEIEMVLEPLIAWIELERLASPLHRLVHRVELPCSDGAQVEQPKSPALTIVEIASGPVCLFDPVGAGPEQVQPVRLIVKLLCQI